MAFTALHPEVGRIDATLPDLGCGLPWETVHRARPRVALCCPGCGHGMHAKLSSLRLRYFAHDPGRVADCAWLNESLEHHMLKLDLAQAARAAGCRAELEVTGPLGTWRADVLATSADGELRYAWEAQLSPITFDLIDGRTDRYHSDGVAVCWVSPTPNAPWLGGVPSILVEPPQAEGPRLVTYGPAEFSADRGEWGARGVELDAFVRWVMRGQLVDHVPLPRYRRSWSRRFRLPLLWTTRAQIESEARHDLMRQQQDQQKREREERERRAAEVEKRRLEAERAEQERRDRERAAELEAERAVQAEALRKQREEEAREWRRMQEERARERQRQVEVDKFRREVEAQAAQEEKLRAQMQEYTAAQRWWADVSTAQLDQLRHAVADHLWQKDRLRAEFDPDGVVERCCYGIAVYLRRRLHGVVRPCPESAYRLPSSVRLYVRNEGEAAQLAEVGGVNADRVIQFGFSNHEQISLI